MYIGYPDAEETDGKSRVGGRCIVSTVSIHGVHLESGVGRSNVEGNVGRN